MTDGSEERVGSGGPGSGGGGSGRPGLDIGAVLGRVDGDGFARADRPRRFEFPDDHGPHPAYRSEWWYVTVNLEDPEGQPIGVQFTLFRQALAPPTPARPSDSPWRAREVWMAHVALTTPQGHFAAERFARGGALGLAGAQAAPLRVWLEDWTLTEVPAVTASPVAGAAAATRSDGPLALRLQARASIADGADEDALPFDVDLQLVAERDPVLQGEDGLSRKSAREGNASYYYSMPRLRAQGRIAIDGVARDVVGLGWLDREWSTSALDGGQVGWDWFALHLDDGRDLMLYRLRRADGSIDAASAGTIIAPDGSVTRLEAGDWQLSVEDDWIDERGARWPVVWRLAVPSAGIDGRVVAQRRDALNRLTVRYWEGPVVLDATGPGPGGRGYLELTGYAPAP